jgi:nitrate/nitrite transporter NarK
VMRSIIIEAALWLAVIALVAGFCVWLIGT